MCGKSKSAPPAATPAPAPVQTTNYVSADNSNSQQRAAQVNSTTSQNQQMASFGSELGSAAAPASTMGAM